jgi:RNA polymerase sigma factor (sigma-70 family)
MSTAFDKQRRKPSAPPADEILDPTDLIMAAAGGDRDAWIALVRRYCPLVQKVIARYRLSPIDADDVCQVVWLRLFQYLDRIREPRALPGWIVTTTRNEALRVISTSSRLDLIDPINNSTFDRRFESGELVDGLLRAERHRALRKGLATLEPRHRELLLLLHAEPQVPYREISRRLGIPTGSIGPTRARCLAKLRASASVATMVSTERDQPAA